MGAGYRAPKRMGRVLRSARHRLRPTHRRGRPALRRRSTHGHPRGLRGRGHPRWGTRPVHLAGELRPTPHPYRESDPRIPTLAHPPQNESTSRTPCNHRLPWNPAKAPRAGLAPALASDATARRQRHRECSQVPTLTKVTRRAADSSRPWACPRPRTNWVRPAGGGVGRRRGRASPGRVAHGEPPQKGRPGQGPGARGNAGRRAGTGSPRPQRAALAELGVVRAYPRKEAAHGRSDGRPRVITRGHQGEHGGGQRGHSGCGEHDRLGVLQFRDGRCDLCVVATARQLWRHVTPRSRHIIVTGPTIEQ